jgi:hypothetical protein
MKLEVKVLSAEQLLLSPMSAPDARQAVRKLATALIDENTGKIQSGYLKLTNSGTLNAGFFYTKGSYSEGAKSVGTMLKQAYGAKLSDAQRNTLNQALAQYQSKTGGALGTRSFVNLVKTLDSLVPDDDEQSPKFQHNYPIDSRLDLSGLEVQPPEPPEPAEAPSQAYAPVAQSQAQPTDATEATAPEATAPDIKAQAPASTQASAADKARRVREALGRSLAELRTRNNSPISDTALKQFQSLALALLKAPREPGDKYSWDQKLMAFERLMFPTTSKLNQAGAVQGPQAPRTFAMGDADGSMGRMVLHAIASGVAELPEENMPALARLMSAELHALTQSEGLEDFQADSELSRDLDEVAEALISKPQPQEGKPACIFLGDILSDRFTNNQQAMSKFIYKLSGLDPENPNRAQQIDTGVRFIAGNHDTMPLLNANGEVRLNTSSKKATQWGAHAHKMLPPAQYRELLKNCFKAADYSAGVLTTHNGVAKGSSPNEYLVGTGNPAFRQDLYNARGELVDDCKSVIATSPEELAEAMNMAFLDRINAGSTKGLVSTDFRPKDRDMTPRALGFENVEGFRQLHGHNDSANENEEGVTNLNAREGKRGSVRFMPASTVIEYAPPAPPFNPAQDHMIRA